MYANKRSSLSRCGGNCKEDSATTELYGPYKIPDAKEAKEICFQRVVYCLNKGCGWRVRLPDVQVSIERALSGKSTGINSYLKRVQKRFPSISMKFFWTYWAHNYFGNFEDYVKGVHNGGNLCAARKK